MHLFPVTPSTIQSLSPRNITLKKRSITQPRSLHLLDDDGRFHGRQRSNSLTNLKTGWKRAAIELREASRTHRQRIFRSVTRTLQAATVIIACLVGLLMNDVYVPFVNGSGMAGLTGGGSAQHAFAASSAQLEALRPNFDGSLPLVEFLDALDALNPAYESMGLMFTVASKEVTTNIKKLRSVLEEQTKAVETESSSHRRSQHRHSEEESTSRSNVSERSALRSAPLDAIRSTKVISLQELVQGSRLPPGSKRVGTPLHLESHKGRNSGLKSASASASFPLVDTQAFEAALWLGFALHFMEQLYGCIGGRGKGGNVAANPAECAQDAYDEALGEHMSGGMRLVSKHLLKIIPNTQEALRIRTGCGDDAASFQLMMSRWSAAAAKQRKIMHQFFSTWPAHAG